MKQATGVKYVWEF